MLLQDRGTYPGGIRMSRYQEIKEKLLSTPRTWLVTGGAGFIGSNLVKSLLQLGQYVRVLDDLSTGYWENVAQVIKETGHQKTENLTFRNGDIYSLETCSSLCEGVDYVLHQAAQVSVPLSMEDPLLNNRTNVDGFLNMLAAARNSGVKTFVFASSCAVYGNDPELPKT